MSKLLVNAPTGLQELVEVGAGGGYFDQARVIWDERTDGTLPAITLGGMVRSGTPPTLTLDSAKLAAHNALLAAAQEGVARLVAIDAAISADTTIATLKAMTNVEFDTWWAANVNNAAQAIAVLKRLARVIIRRML